MCWRKNIKNWLESRKFSAGILGDADEEILAPLVLREVLGASRTLLAVVPVLNQADRLQDEINCWIREFDLPVRVLYLPETSEGRMYLPGNESDRARALFEVLESKYDLIIGSAASFLSEVPSPEVVRESEILLRPGANVPFGELLEKLVALDYDDEFEVNVKGEFSRRGGIIDVFSPASDYPARIEFWGDQIESLRSFDPDTQRSTGDLEEYTVISRGSLGEDGAGVTFFEYIKEIDSALIQIFPGQCMEHLEKFGEIEEERHFEQVLSEFGPDRLLKIFEAADNTGEEKVQIDCFPAAAHLKRGLPLEARDGGMEMLRQLIAGQVRQWIDTGYKVGLLGLDEDACEHIRNWCENYEISIEDVSISIGSLPVGVIFPGEKFVFLAEKELFTANMFMQKTALPRPAKSKMDMSREEVVVCADLDEGDYVVHLIHGIGLFNGIREIESGGVRREVMVLEYRDNAIVYVPMWQASMVSRYVGAQAKVKPHRLGGKKWLADKAGTARAIRDFAADLLRLQAVRNAAEGIAFPDDKLDQRVFEDAFPFEDTADQARAVAEIKLDMQEARPMDRLLCGDVGYGKTEVAIRMAFKAVSAGYQVAVLVPTTVLAQQHFYSFSERFAEYPYTIDMLSRFRTPSEQADLIGKLKTGGIDIVIGTHRLFQEDIVFQKLGLVVIDEEQRFGVKHKERIKLYRSTVDVLTMSATPIPRTLYMAMAGARDLSTIMTAPGFRIPVKTIVAQYDDSFVVEAIRKEVKRGGQVFYIHNRVKTIEDVADKMMELMPDVRFGVAHGQMPEGDLELAMAEFLSGQVDVLICTTIIESGMDIPNANTIIIERADRFGLAELYQLRGRVGRWNRQAYAYLLLPKHNIITSDARKRISAIRRYTHLGAGFRLALRDLEIRGAGNLLGAEQSGHINNVGFDLYCQLLRMEVARMKGETVEFIPEVDLNIDFVHFAHEAPDDSLAAGFPPEYIPSERLRIEAYRRLSAVTSEEQLEAISDEFEDRYGALPAQAENMLDVTRVRVLAGRAGYTSVLVKEGKVYFKTRRDFYRRNGVLPTINNNNPPKLKLRHLLDFARLLRSVESE
jgi:transcription-repair coupling factor (superfamily II helicase)